MRLYCVAIVAGVLASTGASASSFVTVPAPTKAVSPSFVYLGGAEPAVATVSAPVQDALVYPAPLSAGLVSPALPAAPEPPKIALHYPAPFPDALRTPNATAPITRVSTSIITMGEPEVEYFEVAAIVPEPRPKQPPNFSPMVMRGGIVGDAIARLAVPAAEAPQQASVREEKPKPVPRDAPPPAPEPAVAPPPPPPKGLGPLRGVQ